MTNCPCCSDKDYAVCCEPFIEDKSIPPTPEALMRSRYTAYTQANMAYIKKTMKGKVLRAFNATDAKQWALTSTWQGLEIIEAPKVKDDDTIGFVTFVAKYLDGNEPQELYEHSEFSKEGGRWFYVQEHPYEPNKPEPATSSKVGRNDPCTCGSGKKYKKCCGA
jgi:SEC-C motif domain protein